MPLVRGLLVAAGLALAWHLPAFGQGSFGAPAMLPLPATLAPSAGSHYLQPDYPPGIGPSGYSTDFPRQPAPARPVHPAGYEYALPGPQPTPAPSAIAPAMPGQPVPDAGFSGYDPNVAPSGGNCFAEALGDGCGNCCEPCCKPVWFGALGGLFLTRNNPNPVWTSALVNNNFDQVMNTADTDMGWSGGGIARFGQQLCCGQAWEFTYWSIAPLTGQAWYTDPGNLLTPINLFGVDIAGVPVENYFDNADQHAIWRRDTFQNVELNYYSAPLAAPVKPCTLTWLCGLRYFQFNEGLIFGSAAGGSFGANGGLNEAYIDSQVRNRLFGPQIGVIANYFVRPRLSVFAVPKFGIFNNWVSEEFSVYRGDGAQAYTVRENQNFVAFVSELDLGVNFALTPRCSIFGGYMVVIANGVALADNQIPNYLIDTPDIADIKPNGNLILHGVMFGMQFVF